MRENSKKEQTMIPIIERVSEQTGLLKKLS